MKHLFIHFKPLEIVGWFMTMGMMVITTCLVETATITFGISVMIGVTALIYTAKGHLFGPLLMVIFSLLYSLIALSLDYYSEFFTYALMTLPMSIWTIKSWIENPSEVRNIVQIKVLRVKDWCKAVLLTLVVTLVFMIVLVYLKTPLIVWSSLSITTSFLAVYLTHQRSQYYALAYAANDLILVVLWGYAALDQNQYLPMLICFITFFMYDLYGYHLWTKRVKGFV